MWQSILEWISKIFGKDKSITTDKQFSKNAEYTQKYKDISDINFGEIFSNRLATMATSDSHFLMDLKENKQNLRADLLNTIALSVWDKLYKLASLALGTGGSLIVPYVQNGKFKFDIASQDRLCINAKDGEKIIDATVLADAITIRNNVFYRFVNYAIENNTLIITNKVTTQHGRPTTVKQWENIQDIAIQNVDRVPFGFIKSPVDNRDSNDDYGVPITYGCDKIIKEIKDCLKQIQDEFELKKVKLLADERLFDKDTKTGKLSVKDKVFVLLKGMSDKKLAETFSPDIREGSYYARLTKLFELLEKSVGTSRGILTTPDATYENKDAVREANRATWSIVSALRKSIEKAFDDVLYACDVYANYYNMSPAGEYTYKFDWDYSLIESSTETFSQMKDLQSKGAMSKAELRAWATGEDLKTAQEKIDEIAKNEPDLKTLMGMSE